MTSSDLLKAAQAFQNKANNIAVILPQVIGLAKGAVIATNHLLSLPKYQKSAGLQTIATELPTLQQELQRLNTNRSLPQTVASIKNHLSRMAFYTSKSNVGTGYDPITDARDGGYSAPSYFINTMIRLFDTLKL